MTTPTDTPTKSTTAIQAEKPATEKSDKFYAAMPQIPGVGNDARESSSTGSGLDSRRLVQIGGMIAAVLVIGIAIVWWMTSRPRTTIDSSPSDAAVTETPVPE